MRVVAAALVGALVAGVGAYSWRQDEVEAEQARLRRQSARLAQALRAEDRLHQEVEQLQADLELARSDSLAPSLTREPDGRYFGYIRSVAVDEVPATLTIDFAEMLGGAAAQEAAEDAGYVEEGEPVPNDYYIRNVNPKLRRLEIAADATVRTLTEALPELERVSLGSFEQLFLTKKGFDAGHQRSPYWIEIVNGVIVEIEEQYLP